MNDLVLNGISLAQYGAIVSADGSWGSPSRDITVIEIPGRSDPVMQDNGRWNTMKLKYRLGCASQSGFDQIRNVLNSFAGGKIRLEDSYHPEEYRTAWFTGDISPSMQVNNHLFEATVEFTADARRWLKSGEQSVLSTSSPVELTNPSLFPAKPIVRIRLSTSDDVYFVMNGASVSFPAVSTSVYKTLDTETMICTSSNGSAYYNFTTENESNLYLPAGTTSITTNTATIYITPRWYRV